MGFELTYARDGNPQARTLEPAERQMPPVARGSTPTAAAGGGGMMPNRLGIPSPGTNGQSNRDRGRMMDAGSRGMRGFQTGDPASQRRNSSRSRSKNRSKSRS